MQVEIKKLLRVLQTVPCPPPCAGTRSLSLVSGRESASYSLLFDPLLGSLKENVSLGLLDDRLASSQHMKVRLSFPTSTSLY